MKSVVVGLGEFGSAAALAFAQNLVDVIVIDKDIQRINKFKDLVDLAVCLDARDEEGLEAHGVAGADVLVAAIGDFEAQALVVVHAKKLGVKQVVARTTTRDHMRVLQAVGADLVYNPEEEAARQLVQRLLIPNISGYFALADDFSVVEVRVPKEAVGKSLEELQLRRRFRLNLVALEESVAAEGDTARQRLNPLPAPDRAMREGDVLALVGGDLDIAAFMAHYGA